MLDQPAIQCVVEQAVKAGLRDLLMITGRNKRALEDHFDRAPDFEWTLELLGDEARLGAVQHASGLGPIHYLRQGEAKGLGMPCCAPSSTSGMNTCRASLRHRGRARYLKAVITLASERAEFGEDLKTWMKEFLG